MCFYAPKIGFKNKVVFRINFLAIGIRASDPSTFESCELKTLPRKDSQGNKLTSGVILTWIKVWRSPFFYLFFF